jgi:hypothetical protein
MENDRKGTRRFQNTAFSIFNSPFSIRPKGARNARFARIENDKWIMENDRKGTRRFQVWIASGYALAMTGGLAALIHVHSRFPLDCFAAKSLFKNLAGRKPPL